MAGQNLVGVPGKGSLVNASAPNSITNTIMRGVPFSAYVVWRACNAVLDDDCLVHDVFPLLRGAIATYNRVSFTDNVTGLLHLGNVGWESSTEPKGQPEVDNTWNLALWSWSCQVFLDLLPAVHTNSLSSSSSSSSSEHHRPARFATVDKTLSDVCKRVGTHLAPLPVNTSTGALVVAKLPNGTAVPWNQANQMGVELGFPIWPLGLVNLETNRRTTLATADVSNQYNRMCNATTCQQLNQPSPPKKARKPQKRRKEIGKDLLFFPSPLFKYWCAC